MEATQPGGSSAGYSWTSDAETSSTASQTTPPATYMTGGRSHHTGSTPPPIDHRSTVRVQKSDLFDEIIHGRKTLLDAARIGDLTTLHALQKHGVPMTPREEICTFLKQAIEQNQLIAVSANASLELCVDLMRDAISDANLNDNFTLLEALIRHNLYQQTPQYKGLATAGEYLLNKAIECGPPIVVQWVLNAISGTGPVADADLSPTVCQTNDLTDITRPLQPGREGTSHLGQALRNNLDSNLDNLDNNLDKHLHNNLHNNLHKHLRSNNWDAINLMLSPDNTQQLGAALLQALIDGKVESCPANQNLPAWRILTGRAIRMANIENTFHPLEKLIALGLDFSSPSLRKSSRDNGFPLFCKAVRAGSYDTVRWLLTHPDNPEFAKTKARLRDNNTPLHMAIELNDEKMARILLPRSDIGALNSYGETPVTRALKHSKKWLHLIDPEIAGLIEPEHQPASLVPPAKPAVSAAFTRVQPPESHYQALNEMMALYGLGDFTPPELLRQLAVSTNNFKALSVIEHAYFPHHDKPVRHYDKLVVMTMDDDPKRLALAYPQFRRFPGADLVNIRKNNNGICQDEELVVYRNTPFTRHSKIIIDGHGPQLGAMSGAEFALFLDQWLTNHGCAKEDTPRITLNSCKTAGGEPLISFMGMFFVGENFVEDLVATLARQGRFPTVTATSGVMIGFTDGQELCGVFEDQPDGTIKVIKWAGQNVWTTPGYAESRKLTHLSRNNYDPSLVKEYFYDTCSGQVISCQKHEASDEVYGLHSII